MNTTKFLAFTDFHYKKRMYPVTIPDLYKILDRGKAAGVKFALQMGDFCNDLSTSPEIAKAMLENPQGLDIYGVYGNHELEGEGCSMPLVTPKLTNRLDSVRFGTPDGKIGDGMIGHYSFERDGFRFLALDSFYSQRPDGRWEHNAHLSEANGNVRGGSLGEDQLAWLRTETLDAAEKKMPVIVFAHCGFSGVWNSSPDAEAVRAIFREANSIRKSTVVLALNGHYHTNHFAVVEDVAYFDVNVARFGFWQAPEEKHYTDDTEYPFEDFDADGNSLGWGTYPFNKTYGGLHGWFFTEPLSAVVTVGEDGSVKVEGAKTEWLYGIAPSRPEDGTMPEISDFSK